MGHLWFLGNIFVYVILLLPLFMLLKKNDNSKLKLISQRLMAYPFAPFIVNMFFIAEALILKPTPFSMYAKTWHGFTLGFLCFFFGFFFMYIGQPFWKHVLKWRWLYLSFAAILFTIRYNIYATEAPGYLMVVESNSWIFAVFGFCHKYLNKPSKLLSYLSTAAYPVYIIHMLILYMVCAIILPLKLAVYISFPLIVIATFVVCYGIYEFFIRRIKLLHPFFGLRWRFNSSQNKQKQSVIIKSTE